MVGISGQFLHAPEITKFFGHLTDRGAVDAADLLEDVDQKDRQCWGIARNHQVVAVALTRITTGNYKICEITHLTGEGLREWHAAFLEIEKWARSLGCVRIKALARPGYERVGKQYGLRKTHVMLEKDL